MKKYLLSLMATPAFVVMGFGQSRKTENLVIVTLDGMRWEEIFGGIDTTIVKDRHFTRDSAAIISRFQKQLAPAMAALPGFHFVPDQGIAEPITSIYKLSFYETRRHNPHCG